MPRPALYVRCVRCMRKTGNHVSYSMIQGWILFGRTHSEEISELILFKVDGDRYHANERPWDWHRIVGEPDAIAGLCPSCILSEDQRRNLQCL